MDIVLTVGADPEFFLKKGTEFVSAHDIVPGTKDKPELLKDGVCIQADGTAVEFNIPPSRTRDEFASNIQNALDQIRNVVPKEYSFSFTPSVVYPEKYFSTLPSIATTIGCSPEFSASTGRTIRKRLYNKQKTLCTAGGHIHVGWGSGLDTRNEGHVYDCCVMTSGLNHIMQSFSQIWDKDTQRGLLYGGDAYRPKEYGVEYRGMSNAWLAYPVLWPWIFDVTKFVFDNLRQKKAIPLPYNLQNSEFDYTTRTYKYNALNPNYTYKPNAGEIMTCIMKEHLERKKSNLKFPEFPKLEASNGPAVF